MSRHPEGGTEDGRGDRDGTADVLAGHRPSRLVQPRVIILGQNQFFWSFKLVHMLTSDERKMTILSCINVM